MYDFIEYNPDIDQMYTNSSIYSETLQLAAHNSYASIEDGFLYHPQQHLDMKHQFKYGARVFLVDVYDNNLNNDTVLLHNKDLEFLTGISSSLTKIFYFKDYLEDVHYLLEKYNQSVITLIIQNEVEPYTIKNDLETTGLTPYLLATNPNSQNVTFGNMRELNQRLVVFLEKGEAIGNMYSADSYKETVVGLEQDRECHDRGDERAPFDNPDVRVFLMNHFFGKSCDAGEGRSLKSFDQEDCSEVNDYNKIMERFTLCKIKGNKPTFIALDFIEHGDNGGALRVLQDVNNFTNNGFFTDYSAAYGHHYIDLYTLIVFALGAVVGVGAVAIYNHCKPRDVLLSRSFQKSDHGGV